jgi:hypothetical protein
VTPLPIPVHIGSEPPASWDDIEARQREFGDEASPWLRDKRRPAIASDALDWTSLGFAPRWVGYDTADCVVALQPSIFHGQGADEFDRFCQGAQSRGELALVISSVGDLDGKPRSVFTPHGDSIHLGKLESSISSRLLGAGAKVRVAADSMSSADRHLALALINCKPPLPWRSLALHGMTVEAYNGRVQYSVQGTLESIIETELGEPVVAAWVAPDSVERRYVLPAETPWPLVLQWLREHALPQYVPNAIRRARRTLANDETLITRRERAAHRTLMDFEARYLADRADLEREVEEAQSDASGVRDGLLFGTGTSLVDAVRTVLELAGVTVVNLDEQLGGTKNADLLCTYNGHSRLVEVKSASGNPTERAYEDLVRHLREWPQLPESTPVDGGALVLNYQHRTPPHNRAPRPYTRPEFLASQTEPVIATLDLFAAWREENYGTVRALLFGDAVASSDTPAVGDASSNAKIPTRAPKLRVRGWPRRR